MSHLKINIYASSEATEGLYNGVSTLMRKQKETRFFKIKRVRLKYSIKKDIGEMDCGVRRGWKELKTFIQWWNLILRF
jgi:hypothetical protein